MIIIQEVKTISVIVHLVGIGGKRNDWNKLYLSIKQSPSLASFKTALRIVNSLKSNFHIFIY